MKTITGYLSAVENPNFSGLATVRIRSTSGRTTCYCEAGFGVRQLVAAFGENGRFTQRSGEIKARFTIDELGLLASAEPLA